MKSAYLLLGLPGDASPDEVVQAFENASAKYTKAYLSNKPEDYARLQGLQEAFKILSDPQMRAAHDRKLRSTSTASAPIRSIKVEDVPASWYTKPLNVMALLVLALFATGGYMNYSGNPPIFHSSQK